MPDCHAFQFRFGSIESTTPDGKEVEIDRFNSALVRLRDYSPRKTLEGVMSFNSALVRLRAMFKLGF